MTEKRETHAFTYRHDKQEWLRFVAAATLNDTTPTEIFKSVISKYLASSKDAAAEKLRGKS